jgi:hypothetical protein
VTGRLKVRHFNAPRALMRCLQQAALLALVALPAVALAGAGDELEAGRRIYARGILPDGSPLTGKRWDNLVVSGAQAACAACHRTSGMGSVEGDIQVPPVTGNALFGTGDKVIATMDPRSGKSFNMAHEPYDEAFVAHALRSGRRGDGVPMSVLMPRYELNDADMGALLAYLRQLSSSWSPGVTADLIRFATVITPDVSAERRAVFEDMVRKIVAQKNGSTKVAGHGTRHHMTSAAELVLGTERRWSVDFWELHGPPDTWARQLEDLYARQPVFALVSGLGGAEWGPVDAYCDRTALPCWFPSVDPPPAARPKYSIYFNEGVALEARVLAERLRTSGARAPRRVVQVFRNDSRGEGAARALAAALESAGIPVQSRPLAGHAAAALEHDLADLNADEAVMFWLDPADLALLGALPAPAAASYFSREFAGTDQLALPASWLPTARVVYLYELPERRAANLAYFNAWINQRHVALVDETMQSEVFFSFAFLTDTIAEMLDNLHRDYLIERAESMISRREGGKAEAEYYSSTQSHVRTHAGGTDGSAAAPAESTLAPGLRAQRLAGSAFGKRAGTTAFPHLSLGPGQRFASKGGYIARYAEGGVLLADGDWKVP